MVTLGTLGVTTKLALGKLGWPQIVLWAALAYAVIACLLLAFGSARLRLVRDSAYGALSGALAVATLVTLSLALEAGDVSRVVPITSAYPVVTLLLAPTLLSERLTTGHVVATLLVVVGVILLSVG